MSSARVGRDGSRSPTTRQPGPLQPTDTSATSSSTSGVNPKFHQSPATRIASPMATSADAQGGDGRECAPGVRVAGSGAVTVCVRRLYGGG